ncbi:uncharacterized protein LOC113341652 [Papaver somniferum]|uniref:uncharacterized protein LOC113341652 n=1 Tax=Papaver somniferum TaxID=3469 RepID=UPI000E6F920C|nr:uncharacterized protein LOC113341652 [Papaver somniferum]
MTKSQKIEGAFSSPSQASAIVSAAKSNIKTPKTKMFDTKSDIKIPKTEAVAKPEFPENNQTIAALSDRELDIKTPKSEVEHGVTDDDEENSSTYDDKEEQDRTDNSEDHGSSDEDEDEDHGSTDENEDSTKMQTSVIDSILEH